MVNTSTLINDVKRNIEKKIEIEQANLTKITSAMEDAKNFLMENGQKELKDNDILKEVMATMKKLKEKNSLGMQDIDNIKTSISALKSISTPIDKTILSSLEDSIKVIQKNINDVDLKLESVSGFLEILLNIQVECHVCGSHKTISETDKRFNKTSSYCSYCDNTGTITIGKIFYNEKILETDMSANLSKPTPHAHNTTESKKNNYSSPYGSYTINRED